MSAKVFPEDLIVDIFARLPVKSLMRFKCLSKYYYNLIRSPSFIMKHFQFCTKNPRLLTFHYQNTSSLDLCISLISDELSMTHMDFGLPILEFSKSLDLGETEKSLLPINLGISNPETSKASQDLGPPFAEVSQAVIDSVLTFPESSQYPVDACLPFSNESHSSVNLEVSIPRVSQPPVDLGLPFADKQVLGIIPFGPCNGIFFLCGTFADSPDQFILWNPATKEVKVLPLPHQPPSRIDLCPIGFGIDPKTNEYKVVLVMDEPNGLWGANKIPLVEVFSLGTNSWRNVNVNFRAYEFGYTIFNSYLNGVYHWYTKLSGVIVCFDMSNEEFYRMKSPQVSEQRANEDLVDVNVTVLNDCLAYVKEYYSEVPLGLRLEVWVMTEHGLEESWTKRFSIGPYLGLGKFFGFRKDDEFLATGMNNETVVSYNLHTHQPVMEFPVDCGLLFSRPFSYVESIVPLSASVEKKA